MRKLAVGPFHALGRYVSREFWWTFCSLREEHGWRLMETNDLPRHGDHLEPMLQLRAGGWPDVILFWESYPQLVRYAEAFTERGTRVYLVTDDLHHKRNGMDEALRVADGILSTYAPRLSTYFPSVDATRVTWMPHAAGPDFLLPVEEHPQPVVFVSGAMNHAYPLRLAMRDLATRRPELARLHEHPGYECEYDYSSDERVGEGYAAAMRDCLAAFTDALVHQYVVAKHFEIPATGALLLADRDVAPQLEQLGFLDGQHYVSVTADDLETVVSRVLDPRNAQAIDTIRRRGHALVHERHTTAHRARQIDALCRMSMSMNLSTLLSDNRGQFAYFDTQLGHPDWSRARVLDFGGNRGTLLEDAAGAIPPSRYWCLDVSRQAIDAGAQRFPDAHFVHFNRWQHRYNPTGIPNHPLPLPNERFDYILAYSVFTMIDEAETIELVTALRTRLAAGGVLAFTFVDPHHRQLRNDRLISNLEWRLDVAAALGYPYDPDMAATFAGSESCYLIEQRGIEAKPRLAFETFLTAARIRTLFPDCETLPPTAHLRHHCCVIRG